MIYPRNFESKIEFDVVRRLLKELCLCHIGRERVDEMAFMTDYDAITARLNETEELVRILQVEQNFPSDFYFDVREPLQRIRIEGMYMSADELFALRRLDREGQGTGGYGACRDRYLSAEPIQHERALDAHAFYGLDP